MRQSRTMMPMLAAAACMAAGPALAGVEPLHPQPRNIGSGVPDPHDRKRSRSKYMPHQGAREIARRQRQAARLTAGAE